MEVNYLAVLVAAIISYLLGWAWHSPILFGKTWMKLAGFTPESMKSMKMKPATAMTWGFITTLVTAFVLAKFIPVFGVTDVASALALTFWVWLGFIVTTSAGGVLWEGKSANLYFFNIIWPFISIFVMIWVLLWMM